MTDPTPATPDEAVAPMVDLLRAEFDQGHMMVMEPIAERILALSRQQGDTVAARVDEAMVERVARALWEETDPLMPDATDIVPWPDVTEYSKKQWRDRARAILGIVADGAGDGR